MALKTAWMQNSFLEKEMTIEIVFCIWTETFPRYLWKLGRNGANH